MIATTDLKREYLAGILQRMRRIECGSRNCLIHIIVFISSQLWERGSDVKDRGGAKEYDTPHKSSELAFLIFFFWLVQKIFVDILTGFPLSLHADRARSARDKGCPYRCLFYQHLNMCMARWFRGEVCPSYALNITNHVSTVECLYIVL